MQTAQDHYPDCPEAMMVSLARTGDRGAFEELVRRRHAPVRNLMRRWCRDPTLADDLAQQVFVQVWLKIRGLKDAQAFGGWLTRVAVSVWLQHRRKRDTLQGAAAVTDSHLTHRESTGLSMDLDRALAALSEPERLCVVLSYQEGHSHAEIAELTELPLGTVKSHIQRGSARLRQLLSAYRDTTTPEPDDDR